MKAFLSNLWAKLKEKIKNVFSPEEKISVTNQAVNNVDRRSIKFVKVKIALINVEVHADKSFDISSKVEIDD